MITDFFRPVPAAAGGFATPHASPAQEAVSPAPTSEPEAAATEDDGCVTIACGLDKLLVDAAKSRPVIEDAVQRVHKVALFGSEAIALLVLEDIEAGVAPTAMISVGNQSIVRAMLQGVVDGRGARADSEHLLLQRRVRNAYHRIHGADAPLIDASGLGTLIASEAVRFVASTKTSLHRHYAKRVHRYVRNVRLRLSEADFKALTKDERKQHRLRVALVAKDVCRPGWQTRQANEADAPVVDAIRAQLRLDALPWSPLNKRGVARKLTLKDLTKSMPERFLHGMYFLNRALVEAGGRGFRLLPIRTVLTPRFVTIDQTTIKELGFVGKAEKRKLRKDASTRRDAQREHKELIAACKARHTDERREWKETDLARNANLEPKQKRQKPPDEELERREQRKVEMKAELHALQQDDAYRKLCDDAGDEKTSAFAAVFDASGALKQTDAARWAHSLKTDGVSARLLVRRKQRGASTASTSTAATAKKRRRNGTHRLPSRGIISVDDLLLGIYGERETLQVPPEWREMLDGLAPQQQNELLNETLAQLCGDQPPVTIVGVDPGKWELVVLSNPDLEWQSRKHRDATLNAVADPVERDALHKQLCAQRRQRYTTPQRAHETGASGRFYLKPRKREDAKHVRRNQLARAYREERRDVLHTPQRILDAEHTLTAHNANGPTATTLLGYCRAPPCYRRCCRTTATRYGASNDSRLFASTNVPSPNSATASGRCNCGRTRRSCSPTGLGPLPAPPTSARARACRRASARGC